jgi:phosphopentomutase
MEMINRIILIILDSLGVGALPDAAAFNDAGAATLPHIYAHQGRLNLPHLCSLGLGEIVSIGCGPGTVLGAYGKMAEQSSNKDTTSGHWEIAGLVSSKAFPTYPNGFPLDIIQSFEKKIGKKTLGNYPRSGTVILEELGRHHLDTGYPIVYTSADSVFQIAAHEAVTPTETLYEYCWIARNMLTGPNSVARVIARPFKGTPGHFERKNSERKDYSIQPPAKTLLDILCEKGFFTIGIGKIGDIFGHRGLTEEIHTRNNLHGIELTCEAVQRPVDGKGLIFANLVDFDMLYGHRRDTKGYASALEQFDKNLPRIISGMSSNDILMITADHGCDPTYTHHTDHTREYVPLLVYGETVKQGAALGIRDTFADCGQTIADLLGAGTLPNGKSFKDDIVSG